MNTHFSRSAAGTIVLRWSLILLCATLSSFSRAQAQSVIQFQNSDYTVDESSGSASITVIRNGTTNEVSVSYSMTIGTAVAGEDYTAVSGTLTFAIGEAVKTFSVPIIYDEMDEIDETINLSLTDPQGGASLGALSTATLTILDDDPEPTLTINDVTISEGNVGTTSATFTISLSQASGKTVSVDFGTADGTAQLGSDYLPNSGTLLFLPGETSKMVSVTIRSEIVSEPDETFSVVLSSATEATIADNTGVGTILNDDCATITLGPTTLPNGVAGTAYNQTITADGGLTPYTYTLASGTLPDGLTLSDETGLLAGAPTSVGTFSFTITATDAAGCTGDAAYSMSVDLPSLAINDVSVTEPDRGTVNATFTVTLSPPSTQTVKVDFATANGTATSGSDFAATSGTLTFTPGMTTQSIIVLVNGDNATEPNETFLVNLTNPVNASIIQSSGIGTIINDDGLPQLSVHNETVREGDQGTTTARFAVRLSKRKQFPVSVDFATVDGEAKAGSDYAGTSGTLTFNPGEEHKTIIVQVNGDLMHERNESFMVVLSNPVGATIHDSKAEGTILNDDPEPKLAISNGTVTEGNAGTTPLMFAVDLSNPTDEIVTVNYATVDGTAKEPGDYAAVSGMLMFNPGETSQSVTVFVSGDVQPERDEEFFVRLSKPKNARLEGCGGRGKIVDDDLPSIVMRFDDLISTIQSVPLEAFKKPAERRREQLINSVNQSKSLFERGKINAAQDVLQHSVLCHLTNTGPNAWIVEDAVRRNLAQQTSELIGLLVEQIALALGDVGEEVVVELAENPKEFSLAQNYPNPFNPSTTIRYQLPVAAHVSLKVYSITGELAATLVDWEEGAGVHQVQWNPQLPSGTYVYRLVAGEFVATKRMVLLK